MSFSCNFQPESLKSGHQTLVEASQKALKKRWCAYLNDDLYLAVACKASDAKVFEINFVLIFTIFDFD